MNEEVLDDERLWKQYEVFESETRDDFISRYSRTEAELRETIDFLIRQRELLRDVEIQRLEAESQKLIEKLRETDSQKLLAEIECFKEILVLHKKALQQK